jgi:Flp pilus assembly protein TadD
MGFVRWAPIALVAAGVLAYAGSFSVPFVYDDLPCVADNPHIRTLWPLWKPLRAPGTGVDGRPTVCLFLAINYAIGGKEVLGYHGFNVGSHLAASLLLMGILRRTFVACGVAASVPAAFWGALLWGVHPVQTQSVTYVVQRCESLMGLFYLLTFYLFIRGVAAGSKAKRWHAGAVVSCALGMGCKEVMGTAPLLVLFYDRIFLAGSFRRALRARAWLYVGLGLTWSILAALWWVAGRVNVSAGSTTGSPPWIYAATETAVLARYLEIAFWPFRLCLDHWWPLVSSRRETIPALVGMGGLLAGVAWMLWRHPRAGFLGVWFFGILAPTSSFFPIADSAVEHRLYLPLAAGTAGLAAAAGVLLSGRRAALSLGMGGIALALGILAVERNGDYRSAIAAWENVLLESPRNPRAHNNLGSQRYLAGRHPAAAGQFRKGLRINPPDPDAHLSLGHALLKMERVEEAFHHYEEALGLRPGHVEVRYNLANLLLQRMGRPREAELHYRQVVKLQPDFPPAYNNLGAALFQQGRFAEAIACFEEALRLDPDYTDVRANLEMARVRIPGR